MANGFGFEPTNKKETKGLRELYKEKRLFDADTNIISSQQYNLTIGLCIAIGFALDFAMAYFLKNQILRIPFPAVIIAYFIMSFGGLFVVHKSTSAFVSAIGFLVLAAGMGLVLTFILNEYDVSSVYMAFGITAVIALVMAISATVFPQFFLSLGKTLFLSLIIALIADLVCAFLFPGAMKIFDYFMIVIFSGYIGYDWARSQQYPKTMNNAIDSAADLYIDIVNILIRVLEIVGNSKN